MRRYLAVGALWLCLAPVGAQAQTADDLFGSGPIRDIDLRVNTRDLEALRAGFETNTYYPADLRWNKAIARNIAVRSRGGGSRNGQKLGLRLDIDYFVRGQTFVGLESLVLDNLYQDTSMLREHAAFALFTHMGQPAPRTAFARLFINGEYQGVYGLVEEPNEPFVSRHFGARTGFLFEYHWLDPYYFDDLGDELSAYEARFEPRSRETTSAAELFSPIRDLVREDAGESLESWRARVSAVVDLTQLLTVVAIEQFLSEWDGVTGAAGTNNFYLYRSPDNAQHVFIPWDRDNAFFDVQSSVELRVTENRLVHRALAFPDLRSLYLARLTEVAQLAAQEQWLERVIDQAETTISTAAAADLLMPYSPAERAAEAQRLLEFARHRPAIVLEQVRQLRAAER